jgi:importin-5
VHSHVAATALINFCEGVEKDALIPHLDLIVEHLLNPTNENAKKTQTVHPGTSYHYSRYGDAGAATFSKVNCRWIVCMRVFFLSADQAISKT